MFGNQVFLEVCGYCVGDSRPHFRGSGVGKVMTSSLSMSTGWVSSVIFPIIRWTSTAVFGTRGSSHESPVPFGYRFPLFFCPPPVTFHPLPVIKTSSSCPYICLHRTILPTRYVYFAVSILPHIMFVSPPLPAAHYFTAIVFIFTAIMFASSPLSSLPIMFACHRLHPRFALCPCP